MHAASVPMHTQSGEVDHFMQAERRRTGLRTLLLTGMCDLPEEKECYFSVEWLP